MPRAFDGLHLAKKEAKKFGRTVPKAEQQGFINTLEQMRVKLFIANTNLTLLLDRTAT